MKVRNVDDYVKRLEEVFPEVDPESIRAIIKLGNSSVLKVLRGSTATLQLRAKSQEDSTMNFFTMYKYTSAKYNNIAKIIKKKRDKRNAEQGDGSK